MSQGGSQGHAPSPPPAAAAHLQEGPEQRQRQGAGFLQQRAPATQPAQGRQV